MKGDVMSNNAFKVNILRQWKKCFPYINHAVEKWQRHIFNYNSNDEIKDKWEANSGIDGEEEWRHCFKGLNFSIGSTCKVKFIFHQKNSVPLLHLIGRI